ncbi:biopolymer transporter ExbD [uncultured Marinobacter sp.]|uniref:ExbD/TolR family protein n=1 Tax=uncultured Marinobacter sp. TaxID=187379 RepID=UPI0030D79A71
MRRRHRRLTSEADLDITPFMNLMIVLVPVLLINMVFAHTSVLQLSFPSASGAAGEEHPVQPEVIIRGKHLWVTDSEGNLLQELPVAANEDLDRKGLSDVMQQLKARWPEQTRVTLKPSLDTEYQTLVTVMDTVRSYRAVMVTSVVDAELFPEISIGDAPVQPAAAEHESGGRAP